MQNFFSHHANCAKKLLKFPHTFHIVNWQHIRTLQKPSQAVYPSRKLPLWCFNTKINHHSKEAPHTIVNIHGHLVPGTNRSAVDRLNNARGKPARTLSAPSLSVSSKKALGSAPSAWFLGGRCGIRTHGLWFRSAENNLWNTSECFKLQKVILLHTFNDF